MAAASGQGPSRLGTEGVALPSVSFATGRAAEHPRYNSCTIAWEAMTQRDLADVSSPLKHVQSVSPPAAPAPGTNGNRDTGLQM